jgi:hypothetical protein
MSRGRDCSILLLHNSINQLDYEPLRYPSALFNINSIYSNPWFGRKFKYDLWNYEYSLGEVLASPASDIKAKGYLGLPTFLLYT